MFRVYKNILFLNIIFLFFCSVSFSEIVKKIEVVGNQRVSDETIKIFTSISEGQNIEKKQINIIFNNLFENNFFEEVELNLQNNVLTIKVTELPVIQNLIFDVKSSKIINSISTKSHKKKIFFR